VRHRRTAALTWYSKDERSGAGIWHETFPVSARHYEAIYENMPLTGLQKAGRAITVTEARASARQRLGA
jgi:hypothetical protein